MSFFSFLFFFYPKLQFSIAILLYTKEMKYSGVHLLGTSPQTTRVTFKSRWSNIEDARISLLVHELIEN